MNLTMGVDMTMDMVDMAMVGMDMEDMDTMEVNLQDKCPACRNLIIPNFRI